MTRLRYSGWLVLVLGLGLVDMARPARAEHEASHGATNDLKVEKPIVEVTYVDEHGHHVERKFNLSVTKDYDDVIKLLNEDRIVHIAKAEPVDILALRWDLGLWTIVVFALLYFILKKAAWKPMLDGLQRREENIHGALNEAAKAREEAKSLRETLQKEMDKLADQSRALMEEARTNAQRTADELIAKTRAEITVERERLHRELQLAKDQALQELWSQTAQLATLVSSKFIRRQLSQDDHRQLVDEALGELRSSATAIRKEAWGDKA